MAVFNSMKYSFNKKTRVSNRAIVQRSLSCAHDTIKSKIFSGDQDCIGVVLFGSRPTKTDQSDFESVQVLLPLAPPSGAAILALERLLGDHGSATLDAEV